MKNRSSFFKNERGFILPFVLFVTAILLLLISTGISTYKNEITITDNHLEQLKFTTLLQIGREKFKEDMRTTKNTEGQFSYKYPDGNIEISYRLLDGYYRLLITIDTDHHVYRTNNAIPESAVQLNNISFLGKSNGVNLDCGQFSTNWKNTPLSFIYLI